jgi:hypothetical protein
LINCLIVIKKKIFYSYNFATNLQFLGRVQKLPIFTVVSYRSFLHKYRTFSIGIILPHPTPEKLQLEPYMIVSKYFVKAVEYKVSAVHVLLGVEC